MHYCRLVRTFQDNEALPRGDLFLFGVPGVGDMIVTNRCYLVQAVKHLAAPVDAHPTDDPPPEPQVLIQVRRLRANRADVDLENETIVVERGPRRATG